MTVFIFVIKNTSTNNFRHILWNCNTHLENVKNSLLRTWNKLIITNTIIQEIIRKIIYLLFRIVEWSIFNNYEVLQHSWNFHCTSTKIYENFLRVWIAWLARWKPHINTSVWNKTISCGSGFPANPIFLAPGLQINIWLDRTFVRSLLILVGQKPTSLNLVGHIYVTRYI